MIKILIKCKVRKIIYQQRK